LSLAISSKRNNNNGGNTGLEEGNDRLEAFRRDEAKIKNRKEDPKTATVGLSSDVWLLGMRGGGGGEGWSGSLPEGEKRSTEKFARKRKAGPCFYLGNRPYLCQAKTAKLFPNSRESLGTWVSGGKRAGRKVS